MWRHLFKRAQIACQISEICAFSKSWFNQRHGFSPVQPLVLSMSFYFLQNRNFKFLLGSLSGGIASTSLLQKPLDKATRPLLNWRRYKNSQSSRQPYESGRRIHKWGSHAHTCVPTVCKVGHASNVEVVYIHYHASDTLRYIYTPWLEYYVTYIVIVMSFQSGETISAFTLI